MAFGSEVDPDAHQGAAAEAFDFDRFILGAVVADAQFVRNLVL